MSGETSLADKTSHAFANICTKPKVDNPNLQTANMAWAIMLGLEATDRSLLNSVINP